KETEEGIPLEREIWSGRRGRTGAAAASISTLPVPARCRSNAGAKREISVGVCGRTGRALWHCGLAGKNVWKQSYPRPATLLETDYLGADRAGCSRRNCRSYLRHPSQTSRSANVSLGGEESGMRESGHRVIGPSGQVKALDHHDFGKSDLFRSIYFTRSPDHPIAAANTPTLAMLLLP